MLRGKQFDFVGGWRAGLEDFKKNSCSLPSKEGNIIHCLLGEKNYTCLVQPKLLLLPIIIVVRNYL